MQQQQNKPVLTMRMLLFLCTSIMMTSPVVEGVHTVRVAALSEATATATNTKTMRMKRRSVQDVGVRVSSESGVRNFIDLNNNDATNQPSPEDNDHENHDDHNDHTFTFTELYNDNYDNDKPIIADPTNNVVEPTIMNYNDLNNNDAAVDESSEVVMNYNDLTNATTVDAATIDIVTPIMNYNDLNNNDAPAESEVVMNYNDLTNADADAAVDGAATTDIVTAIMNYNDLTATAADDAALVELLTPTMTPPQENTVIIGRASTATASCACRNTDTTDVIRARINKGETRPPCQETDLDLNLETAAVEVEVEVVKVAGIELEVVKVEVEVASEGEGEEDLLGVNIISLGEYDSLYGTTNDNEKASDTAVIVDVSNDNDATTDTVIADASRSSVDDGSTTKQRDPMVITTICFGILILFLLLLLVCNYRCWKLQKQREQEELCGQYVFDIPDTSHSENDDEDEDSAAVLKDGEMEYPIHKIVVGSHSEEENSHGKFGIRRKLSRLVEYVVSIKTTRNGQADILTDVHRCTSAFCPVCEKQRKAIMSCESYDIKTAGQQQQQEAIPQDDGDEGKEAEEEYGSVIYVPRGDEEMGVGVGESAPSFYVYETDNDNAEIETRHERHTVFQSPTKIPLLPPPVVPVRRPTGTNSRNRSRTTATAKPRREPVPTVAAVRRPRSHKATPRRTDP